MSEQSRGTCTFPPNPYPHSYEHRLACLLGLQRRLCEDTGCQKLPAAKWHVLSQCGYDHKEGIAQIREPLINKLRHDTFRAV